jgi:ABC-type polysaccharide/polyol phosphate export permease
MANHWHSRKIASVRYSRANNLGIAWATIATVTQITLTSITTTAVMTMTGITSVVAGENSSFDFISF